MQPKSTHILHVHSPVGPKQRDNLDHRLRIPYHTILYHIQISVSLSTFFLSFSLTKPELSPFFLSFFLSFRPLSLYKLPIMHPWQQSQEPKKGENDLLFHVNKANPFAILPYIQYIHIYISHTTILLPHHFCCYLLLFSAQLASIVEEGSNQESKITSFLASAGHEGPPRQ
uniref:Uncharacterized protein n=1 Tax=Oryza brachyantha TaxID=4533 RepID=J3KV83_ORYBR